MPSRAERLETARLEAGLKLIFLVIIAIAFLVGGLSGFTTVLITLLKIVIGGGFVLLASYTIVKSRFTLPAKLGMLSVLGSLVFCGLWFEVRTPRQWIESGCTVVGITGLVVTTDTSYEYQADEFGKGFHLRTSKTRLWKHVADARSFRPEPITISYNRKNPNEVSFETVGGWGRSVAKPTANSVSIKGAGTATLRIDSGFSSYLATISGPHVRPLSEGARYSIWINPNNQTEVSLQPQDTVGGQQYWILGLAGVLGLVGGGCMVSSRGSQKGLKTLKPSTRPGHFAQNAEERDVRKTASAPSIENLLFDIDWYQFEKVSAIILESEGWEVTRAGGQNPDGGADLVATRHGRKVVVQCKHWRSYNVGVKVVRELLGAKTSAQFSADSAILLTIGDLTPAARDFAAANGVTIYDSQAIQAAVARIGLPNFPMMTNADNKMCPKCDAPMVLREMVDKPFWGCSLYPRCTGIIECKSISN